MSATETYYNTLASVYDQSTEAPGAWTPPEYLATIAREKCFAQGRILDVGIGTGRVISSFYNAGHRNIVGVDCSPKMLSECKNKYPEITLIEGLFEEVDLSPLAPFSLILSAGAFEFVRDLPLVILKASRLLQNNGALLFSYEPLIHGHHIQGDPSSLVVSNRNSEYFVEDFYTFRHQPSTVRNYIEEAGLRLVLDSEFVAYKKSGHSIIYHCILALKTSP